MLIFPEFIVSAFVYGALGLTALGLIILVVLLIKDRNSKSIW